MRLQLAVAALLLLRPAAAWRRLLAGSLGQAGSQQGIVNQFVSTSPDDSDLPGSWMQGAAADWAHCQLPLLCSRLTGAEQAWPRSMAAILTGSTRKSPASGPQTCAQAWRGPGPPQCAGRWTGWCLQGSCGYGLLSKDMYPFWCVCPTRGSRAPPGAADRMERRSVGALSTSNMFYQNDAVQGCGWVPALLGSMTAAALRSAARGRAGSASRSSAYRTAAHTRWGPLSWLPFVSDGKQLRRHTLAVQGRCNSDPGQRSVTIMITDACPECEANHIDLQALTFQKARLREPVLAWAPAADLRPGTR